MPGTSSYISVAELAAFLRIADAVDDAQLATAASAASRLIDGHCGRAFDLDATPVARAFTWPPDQWYGPPFLGGQRGQVLPLADIGNVTGIVLRTDEDLDGVFETTWTLGTDYRLSPPNALLDAEPYTEIRAVGSRRFPYTAYGVQVTARWGWPSIPDPIRQAAFLLGARLFSRRGAPFAVLQTPDVGASYVPRIDADVDSLLRPYRRLWAVA